MFMRFHLLVSGIVQGVSFRRLVKEEAVKLGLVGFVRNLPDGRVEIVVEGEANPVHQFVSFCMSSPGNSCVEEALLEEESITGEFSSFSRD
ncbi:acylphosphatase [Candidatus Woesearchaeota archaeon]|nr:acylphosphatase [Candidatus Woesearchaeota archaeon]